MARTKTPKPSPPKGLPTPRARFQLVGEALRSSLVAVLAQVGGAQLRPVSLAKGLRLDDSLAARLLRSARASDPLSTLREAPTPAGLRLFLDAAARAGVTASARQTAEAAIAQFEGLLAELPLGKSSLDTAIDGWLPSGRAKSERSGRQAVFKALAQTLGYTIDTTCFATAIQPSASGDMCDAITFVGMDGIRRLREGAPILLFGHMWNTGQYDTPGGDTLPPVTTETIDGETGVTDARKLLLKDVGDSATLPLRMIERGPHTRVVIDSSAPSINVPVTAAVSYISRNLYMRYQLADRTRDVFTNACKVPIRTFVQDFYIHEDAYPGFSPEIVARMDCLGADPATRDDEVLEIERLDLDVELVRLGWGLDRVAVKEWAGYHPAMVSVFERAGWDPKRFRAYRCTIMYPFPFVSLTTWFDLSPRPERTREKH